MQFATELLVMDLAGKVEKLNKTALVDLVRELKMVKEDIDFTDTLGVVRALKNAAAKAHIVRNDADQSVVMKIEFENGKVIAINFGKCDDITYGFIDVMPRTSRWSTLSRAVVIAMNNITETMDAEVDIEDTKEEEFGLEFESMDEFKEIVTDIAVRALRNTATVPEEIVEELIEKFEEELGKMADEVINEIAEECIEELDGCDGDCCPDCEEDCDLREEQPEPKKAKSKELDIDELIQGVITAIKSFDDSFGKLGGK